MKIKGLIALMSFVSTVTFAELPPSDQITAGGCSAISVTFAMLIGTNQVHTPNIKKLYDMNVENNRWFTQVGRGRGNEFQMGFDSMVEETKMAKMGMTPLQYFDWFPPRLKRCSDASERWRASGYVK